MTTRLSAIVVVIMTMSHCLPVCLILHSSCSATFNDFLIVNHAQRLHLLYLPSERSGLARHHVILFSARPSVRTQYLDANILKMV